MKQSKLLNKNFKQLQHKKKDFYSNKLTNEQMKNKNEKIKDTLIIEHNYRQKMGKW